MSQIIFRGVVTDVDDPKNLGRIRVEPIIENTAQKKNASLTYGEQLWDFWDKKDPFVFHPLNPFFTNLVPKVGEYVNLIYANPDKTENLDRYYIGPIYSSALLVENEPYNSAVTNLEIGSRNLPPPDIFKSSGGLTNELSEGVFIKPEDVGVQGRGGSDIVVKKNHILLRSGKYVENPNKKVPPNSYIGRGFLQISKFEKNISFGLPSKKKKLKTVYDDLKILVEYYVENSSSTQGQFTGNISIYKVKPGPRTSTKNFRISGTKVDLNVGEDLGLGSSIQINTPLNHEEYSELVNKIIKSIVDEKDFNEIKSLNDKYNTLSISGQKIYRVDNIPLYFRPNPEQYKKSTQSFNPVEKQNLNSIFNKINVNSGCSKKGYNLVFDKKYSCKAPTETQEITIVPQNTSTEVNTSALMGADTIYLLSHKSNKSNNGQKIDLDGTLYGIDRDRIANEIEPKTSSMVRGEEMLELLEMIVEFLFKHVHPYPGLPPIPVGYNSTITMDQIQRELLNANQKVLNKNIRIN
jgi:hypothetical protein